MKPDFSPESQSPFSLLWENSGTLLFLPPLVFPSPAHTHLESVNDQNLMEGLIKGIVQRHPTSVLMVRRLFFLPVTCLLPPVRKTNMPLLYKDVERRVKMCVCVKKNRDVRGGTLEETRGCEAEGTSQTSLGSLRDAPVLNLNTIERHDGVRNLNQYFTYLSLSAFFLYLLAEHTFPQQRCCML